MMLMFECCLAPIPINIWTLRDCRVAGVVQRISPAFEGARTIFEINTHHFLEKRNQNYNAGTFDALETTKCKHHGALI